jgi:hypothetical protein
VSFFAREQLEDRRNVGESSCNFGDGTDQRIQPLMIMMMMMMMMMMMTTMTTTTTMMMMMMTFVSSCPF